jgi:predicted MPP superfamily phosphohydrolase
MKIGLISDIHAEMNDLSKFNKLNFTGLDILVVAGDTWYKDKGYNFIKKNIMKLYPKLEIVFVCGNHDYWTSSFESVLARYIDISNKDSKFHFLENNYIIIGNVGIVGATLWTDYNNENPLSLCLAPTYMNDYHKIRTSYGNTRLHPNYLLQRHQQSLAVIEDTLDYLKKEKKLEKLIVVTHHAPFLDYRFMKKPVDSTSCFYFYSDLYNKVNEFRTLPNYWLYGHTHDNLIFSQQYKKGEVTYLSNALGYPFEPNEFSENCCVDLINV